MDVADKNTSWWKAVIYKVSKKSSFTGRVDDWFAVLLSLFITMCKEPEVFRISTGSDWLTDFGGCV